MGIFVPYGERLREERLRIGISMQQMADLCGVTLRTQAYYERSEREPGRDYLEKAAALGVDVLKVVTGEQGEQKLQGDSIDIKEQLFLKDWRLLDDAGRKAVHQMIAALLSK